MASCTFSLLALALLPTASTSQDGPASHEVERLQGIWQFVAWEGQGVAKPSEEVAQYTAVLRGDLWTVSKGKEVAAQVVFRVDPSKTPKTMEFIDIKRARIMRGIYSLEGETLRVCDRDVEKGERPTKFATTPDSGLVLVTLRRLKPGGRREDSMAAERAKLQGNWRFVSMEVQGQHRADMEFSKSKVVFQGDQWTVSEDHRIAAQSFFRMDPTKTPKTIDIVDIDKGRLIRGIYKLEGDTFTVCDRGAEKDGRPAEFATRPDSGLVLVVLARAKP